MLQSKAMCVASSSGIGVQVCHDYCVHCVVVCNGQLYVLQAVQELVYEHFVLTACKVL